MRRIAALLGLALAVAPLRATAARDCAIDPAELKPRVVVALLDTGINPFAPAFRDGSNAATLDPCTYLPGYPTDPSFVMRADFDHDAETYRDARASLQKIVSRFLYWFPGTKIVGGISFGAGGVRCPGGPTQAPFVGNVGGQCPFESPVVDEHGHGSMTATRSAGATNSLAPEALIVEIEGPGDVALDFAADNAGWIDVVSNSWGYLTPWPTQAGVSRMITAASEKQMILFASGNGLGLNGGVAPNPTYLEPTAPPGAILVGAHDNGHVSPWSSAPAHVVADGYGGYASLNDDLDPPRPHPMACCTSAAAPYAAGGAAQVLLRARQILGDVQTGSRVRAIGGVDTVVVAEGTPPPDVAASASPLGDGFLTMAEWRAVFLKTAEARPGLGADDGLIHITGDPQGADQESIGRVASYGVGQNPFCVVCYTLPIEWSDVSEDYPAHASIGYGAINERSVASAEAVLLGTAALPDRPTEDAFFAQDEQVRRTMFR